MILTSLLATASATQSVAQNTSKTNAAAAPGAPTLDEDPLDEIVTDPNASAEVKLPVRRSKFPIPFWFIMLTQMGCNKNTPGLC